MEKMYTAQEVADYLKIKKTTVYELIKRGELASAKIGKQIRISQAQLEQYMNAAPSSSLPAQPPRIPSETDIPDSVLRMDYLSNANGLIVSGQDSSVVELLKNQMELTPHPVPLLHSYMNTYNSLYSLYFEKIHLALVSLSDSADPEKVRRQVTPALPGIPVTILHIGQYQEGLLTSPGNPLKIHSLDDLPDTSVRIANREKGSSIRMYLDTFLSRRQLPPTAITGYEKEYMSGMSAANAVASGTADVCISSSLYTAFFPALEFIPLNTASMDLIFHSRDLELPPFQAILECVRSDSFKNSLRQFYHYRTERTGELY
ncbi:MAG: substrate-binding domain-containing protein [Ruminococcus sp.]|jgi:putative molybdopterin biosynthesis protein